MRRLWRSIRVFAITLQCTIYTSVAVRFKPVAERPAFRARRQQIGSRRLCRAMGFRVQLRGAPPAGRPMLYVSNHLSAFDPLILGGQMPVAFAGKAELRAWPLIGWVCATHGMIFVDRDRRTSTTSFVEQVQAKLQAGVSVLVFPEGTTGLGETVKPFKTGAFEAVARRADGAVLPLFIDVPAVEGVPVQDGRRVISHTDEPFIDHTLRLFSIRNIDIVVTVGEPVAATRYDRKQLARMTHEAVEALAQGHSIQSLNLARGRRAQKHPGKHEDYEQPAVTHPQKLSSKSQENFM